MIWTSLVCYNSGSLINQFYDLIVVHVNESERAQKPNVLCVCVSHKILINKICNL